jgi:hypothetical protein
MKKLQYLSIFTYTFGDGKMIDVSIMGKNEDECLKKTEKFLQTELLDTEYSCF